MTENTRRGARGLILPASTAPGNPGENTLLPQAIAELNHSPSGTAVNPRSLSTAST